MTSPLAMSLPPEDARTRTNAALGMIIFVGSWTMAFGVLIVSLFILRDREPVWPPQGVVLPSLSLALLATGVLALSSFVLHKAVGNVVSSRNGAVRLWGIALALGLVFAGLQTWLWMDLWAAGRQPWAGGIYESLFYGLTWFHGVHVVCGLLALVVGQIGLMRGDYGSHRYGALSNMAVFWHFVDALWIVLFLCLFII